MVVAVIAALVAFRELSRNRAGPKDQPTAPGWIVKDFRRPDIAGGRLVFHHWNGALFGPMHQIGRMSVADDFALLSCPAGGPDQVEGAAGSGRQTGVAHEASTDSRLKEGAVIAQSLP